MADIMGHLEADDINNNLPAFYRELYKKMLFWKSWFDKKIFFIQDILSGNGKFVTFEELQNKFSIKNESVMFTTFNSWLPFLPT